MKLTLRQVLKILKNHHIDPLDDTLYDPRTSQFDAGSSFLATVGLKEYYDISEIRDWLGY